MLEFSWKLSEKIEEEKKVFTPDFRHEPIGGIK